MASSWTAVWLMPSFWASAANRRLASGLRRMLVIRLVSIAHIITHLRYKTRGSRMHSVRVRLGVSVLILFVVLPLLVAWWLLPWVRGASRGGGSVPTVASAQDIMTCVPNKTLISTVGAGTDIPVSATPVDVLTVSSASCTRLLWNKGLAPIRCLSKNQGTPTATVGLPLGAGEQILF